MSQERLDIVRRMWAALREGGAEAALGSLAPDVVFVARAGDHYRGHDGVRAFFARFEARDERFLVAPFTFEPIGAGVLVVGHRRIAGPNGTVGEHLYFTHRIAEGLIVDLRAFGDRDSAIASLRDG